MLKRFSGMVLLAILIISSGIYFAQNSESIRNFTYVISRNVDKNTAFEISWFEVWEVTDQEDFVTNLMLLEGKITDDQEIDVSCYSMNYDPIRQVQRYYKDGNELSASEISPEFDYTAGYLQAPTLAPSNCTNVGNDKERCEVSNVSIDAGSNFSGQAWLNRDSHEALGYLVNAEDQVSDTTIRYQQVDNILWSNSSVDLDCFAAPINLPQGAIVTAYTATNYAVFIAPMSQQDLNQFTEQILFNWIPIPDSNDYIGGPGNQCRLSLNVVNNQSAIDIELSVVTSDSTLSAIESIAEAGANSPLVTATNGREQSRTGTVSENATALIREFEIDGWTLNQELTIIYENTGFLTLTKNNSALHIFIEDAGGNQVIVRYEIRDQFCGANVILPSNE